MHLVKLEQEALALRKKGHYKEAIKLYKRIVQENPNWEWGACFYKMADCYEELGEYEKANENYLKSMEYDDEDSTRLGNYVSFLYLYGTPKEALKWYLKLFDFEKKHRFDTEKTLLSIKSLAEKLNLTDYQLQELLDKRS